MYSCISTTEIVPLPFLRQWSLLNGPLKLQNKFKPSWKMKCKLSVRQTGSSDPFRKKICRSRFFPCGHSQRQDNELVFLNGRQDLPPGHAHYRSTHLSQHDFNIAARPPCDFGEEQSQYLLTSTWLEKN